MIITSLCQSKTALRCWCELGERINDKTNLLQDGRDSSVSAGSPCLVCSAGVASERGDGVPLIRDVFLYWTRILGLWCVRELDGYTDARPQFYGRLS